MADCLVCLNNKACIENERTRDSVTVRCPNCGRYTISGTAEACVPHLLSTDTKRAILSHHIRKAQQGMNKPVLLFEDQIKQTLMDYPHLPSPAEQADNLILHIGEELVDSPSSGLSTQELFPALIGSKDIGGVFFVLKYLLDYGLLEGETSLNRLTFKGWEHYESLKRERKNSRTAFMAMKFYKDSEHKVRRLYERFQKAARDTGFELRNDCLDAKQAGLIDDHMRVAIRNAKFVVAELTDGNKGAYWEAGFAEGLGKKVIYVCEKNRFEDTHFDTNHHQTIVWEEDKLAEAASDLKAMIRNSFWEEAIEEDPVE